MTRPNSRVEPCRLPAGSIPTYDDDALAELLERAAVEWPCRRRIDGNHDLGEPEVVRSTQDVHDAGPHSTLIVAGRQDDGNWRRLRFGIRR